MSVESEDTSEAEEVTGGDDLSTEEGSAAEAELGEQDEFEYTHEEEEAEPEEGLEDDEASDEEAEGDKPEDEEKEASQEATSLKPFILAADHIRQEIPGSYVTMQKDADGNEVPVTAFVGDSFQRYVQPHLANRGEWYREKAQLQAQIEALNPENNPEVTQLREVFTKVDEALKALDGGDQKSLIKFLDEFGDKWSLWNAQAEAAAAKHQAETSLSLRDTQVQADAAIQVRQTVNQSVPTDVSAVVEQLGVSLPDEVLNEIIGSVTDDPRSIARFYGVAKEGNQFGFPADTVVLLSGDDGRSLLSKHVESMARLALGGQTSKRKSTRAKKTVDAAKRKAAKTPGSTSDANAVPVAETGSTPDFKDREEYENWLHS